MKAAHHHGREGQKRRNHTARRLPLHTLTQLVVGCHLCGTRPAQICHKTPNSKIMLAGAWSFGSMPYLASGGRTAPWGLQFRSANWAGTTPRSATRGVPSRSGRAASSRRCDPAIFEEPVGSKPGYGGTKKGSGPPRGTRIRRILRSSKRDPGLSPTGADLPGIEPRLPTPSLRQLLISDALPVGAHSLGVPRMEASCQSGRRGHQLVCPSWFVVPQRGRGILDG